MFFTLFLYSSNQVLITLLDAKIFYLKWHLSFIDYSDENLLNDASSKVNDDIDENDEVYKYEG